MKKYLPFLIGTLIFLLYPVYMLSVPVDSNKSKAAKFLTKALGSTPSTLPEVYKFAELPLVFKGRIKPFDTVARNSLRYMSDTEDIYLKIDGKKVKVPQVIWMLDVISDHERVQKYRMFRIHHPDILKNLNIESKKEYNSKYTPEELYAEIEHKHDDGHSHSSIKRMVVREEAQKASKVPAKKRSAYESEILRLEARLNLYEVLKNSFLSRDFSPEELILFYNNLSEYVGGDFPRPIPTVRGEWESLIFMNVRRFGGEEAEACWKSMNNILTYWRDGKYKDFNDSLKEYQESLAETIVLARESLKEKERKIDEYEKNVPETYKDLSGKNLEEAKESAYTYIKNSRKYIASQKDLWGDSLGKMHFERFFNHFSPFYMSMYSYVILFIVTCFAFLFYTKQIWKVATTGLVITFIIHTFALYCRYYISGYPPVTSLYSSAVFIGWGVSAVGVLLELYFKRFFGIIVSCIVGYTCLFIAHNLSLDEQDTMGVMKAVLDTKFWLTIHVITITLGYTATFLAGGIGMYWVAGKLAGRITKSDEKAMLKAIYGVICYGMFLSFVGTVLGGLWADDSWGRFWGWDPKENGALLIVIWNAIILHAKWCGLARQKGLVALAILGNVVTAFSWFGVNLLGVGLHSYGFTDSGYEIQRAFALLNLAFVILCSLNLQKWKEYADESTEEDSEEEDALSSESAKPAES